MSQQPTSTEQGDVVLWFRRDLRLGDHPALEAATTAARSRGARVVPLVVLDPSLAVGESRRARYAQAVDSLASDVAEAGGHLEVREGDPAAILPQIVAATGATSVLVTGEHSPYARRRDLRVSRVLEHAGVRMTSAGSCHVVTPGTLLTKAGTPSKVFTPFFRTWLEHVRSSSDVVATTQTVRPDEVPWARPSVPTLPAASIEPSNATPSEVGEQAALVRWDAFLALDLEGYRDDRDRPDLDSTSRLSIPLRLGEIHPARLAVDLLGGVAEHDELDPDVEKFLSELAWRDFYADVLWHRPETVWHDLHPAPAGIHDAPGPGFEAWRTGRTGYPVVDAGMRQLLAQGWMHNRVRMITASFLVKDLLLPWQLGARHFLDHLLDGDPASNQHGWQWVAGTGTDASPYHRVMNPTTQALRFDPTGDYVRHWIPELRHVPGKAVHEPWKHPDAYAHGYPRPVVDHAEARTEALLRWRAARG